MNVRFKTNISKEEEELLRADKALKTAEEHRKKVEKYAKLQELAKQAAEKAEKEALDARHRAIIAAANTKKELECVWIDNKKKPLYIRAKEKLIEFIKILDDGELQHQQIENEIRNLRPEVLDNLAKKANILKDNFEQKKRHQQTRKRRNQSLNPLENLLKDTSTFSFVVFFLVTISFIMSKKMHMSSYRIVNRLMGLYGEWRGFREFAAECVEEDNDCKKYKENSVDEIDEKWEKNNSKPKLTEIFCKNKKPLKSALKKISSFGTSKIVIPEQKPKLTKIFPKKEEEKLPTLYEAYRSHPLLKSCQKGSSSFGQSKIILAEPNNVTSFGQSNFAKPIQNNWIIEKTNNY